MPSSYHMKKKKSSKQVVPIRYTLEKKIFIVAILLRVGEGACHTCQRGWRASVDYMGGVLVWIS